MKVYITYENSRSTNITGIYFDRDLAVKEAIERHDLGGNEPYIESFKVKGNLIKYIIKRLLKWKGE